MGEVSLEPSPTYERTPFGKEMLKHFLFDPSYKNLNHGSFGTFPLPIRNKQREYQDLCEAAPDPFIRYTYPKLSDVARGAVAKVLNCPTDTVVFVANATTGVNTVLRNIVWNQDGKDEILYFRHIYGACLKTVEYVCEANHDIVNPREIIVEYPMEDADLLALFRNAIKASRAEGKRPRLAIYDAVSSLPGLRMPFEDLTAACKEEGILSLVDAAHGIGHVHLDLTTLDPDFVVTNAHKWLFVPRGCAVFYVPIKNQPLMRSSLPTSHGFVPKTTTGALMPLPPPTKSEFVNAFEFIGTIDNTNYLVAGEAIKWREEVCGGEKAIIDYNTKLAREGGATVAKILGTKVLDNATHSLTNCCLVNVLLPLAVGAEDVAGTVTIKPEHIGKAKEWLQSTLIDEHKTFLAIWFFQGQFWARLSGQIYLEMEDFVWAGETLKKICQGVAKQQF
ncbi:hypothetical protein IFR04_004881 [Cadophora malorum]|uniref:Aminotransferase class V domain-containing protein n=1 Tax=Cadophora malorum TaxID=108018 RepID=A0A8H7WC15_9HELO|nr:hypothetical protein IFR04_004881 [Cadophora malorum]